MLLTTDRLARTCARLAEVDRQLAVDPANAELHARRFRLINVLECAAELAWLRWRAAALSLLGRMN